MTENNFDVETFFGFNVIISKNTGFINVTEFCKQYTAVEFSQWYEKKSTQKLFKTLLCSDTYKGKEIFTTIHESPYSSSASLDRCSKFFGEKHEKFTSPNSGNYICRELFLDFLFWFSRKKYADFLSETVRTKQKEITLEKLWDEMVSFKQSVDVLNQRLNYQYLPIISNKDFKILVDKVACLTDNLDIVSKTANELKKLHTNETSSSQKLDQVLDKQKDLAKWFWAQLLISAAKSDELCV